MIIATKLHIPNIRTPLVVRPRLMEKLNEGLNRTLTLLTSPAGYGKTTLLSQWVTTSSPTTAWVSLDDHDNQFFHFWSHSLVALTQAEPSFDMQRVLAYYEQDSSGASLVASLINELYRLGKKLVLIWDDFHYIENQQILDSIAYVLQRMPPHIHLYMASRELPSLSLARLKTSGELNQLTIDDLRFTLTETNDYFRAHQLINISTLAPAKILEETEGWIAGLRLATMSWSGNTKQSEPSLRVAGDKRDVTDYFFEEVLSKQSHEIYDFLLKTSILERMNAALCTAVTGIENSAALLQELEEKQLFIVPLDDQRKWYRYHHLFQQFLRQQLQLSYPTIVHTLHTAAGHWLAEQELEHEAVEHFLTGASYDNALDSLQKMLPRLQEYERTTVYQWLNQIPSTLLFHVPMLYLANLASLFLSGQIEEATAKYWWAIHQLKGSKHTLSAEEINTFYAGLSFLVAFRGYLEKDFTTCLEYSKEYLARDPDGSFLVGFGSNREGYHPLWDIHVSSGHLPRAEQILQELLQLWSTTNNVYFVAHLCIDYGKLLYEWNRLPEAKQYVERSLHIGLEYENMSLVVISSVCLARINQVTGADSEGEKLLDSLKQKVDGLTQPKLKRLFELSQVQLKSMRGMLGEVDAWVHKSKLATTDEITFSMIDEYELLASVLAEQGALEAALTLTEHLFQLSQREEAQAHSLRLLLRKSLLFARQGRDAQSIDVLEEALCLGETDGYLRTFIDEGQALIPLLSKYIYLRKNKHRLEKKKVSLAYTKKLLYLLSMEYNEAREDRGQGMGQDLKLVSPLTVQERTVLQLIQIGLKNKEIATRLDIALSTVKTHINNIYRKLQVKNRFMAVERVKEWGLFDDMEGYR